jgi:CRISPR-associated protein Csd1
MMLRALYELAKREGIEDPHFSNQPVHFILRIDEEGRALSLVSTAGESGRAEKRSAPQVPVRTVAVAPGYLFDNAKYVLGLSKPEDKPDRVAKCAEQFTELVDGIVQRTQDVAALAVSRFLHRRKEELPKILGWRPRAEWSGSENIAFILGPDDQSAVFERARLRQDLAELSAQPVPDAQPMQCLVTGAWGVPERLHHKVKLIVDGAQTGGMSLVSFNAAAFESQGLEHNAPVSPAAAAGYVAALNWLVERVGDRRFRQGVALGSDAVTVFWTREKHGVEDLLAWFFDPGPDQVRTLLESPRKGLEPSGADETKFYAITLSGNSSRLVVRDWLETTVREVKANVRRWFDDLRLGREEQPLSVYSMLKALEGPDGRGISPNLEARLFGAALRGWPIPREVLATALRRLRLRPKEAENHKLVHTRIALIKATLLRLTPHKEVSVSLDESNRDVPYLLGRLFAVLERLQGAALGDVNASIRDRFFSSASSTPGVVFPRLLQLSVHHAAKADNAGWLEKLKGQIMGGLTAQRFPMKLLLEDQGLFAIGYYHQRESFFTKRETVPESAAA